MQKGANCYASHNIATMSKAGPTDLTAILLAALIAKHVPGPNLQGYTARMQLLSYLNFANREMLHDV